MKKENIFKFTAVILPFVALLLLEVALRLFGNGTNYNFFNSIEGANGERYRVLNSAISKKYFKDSEFKSDDQSDLFLEEKTDSTFRVFVMGASTVVGYPFYKGGSFPRMLKQRLSFTFPDKNIEVVNTGITAVNSYTLWDFTKPIIEQKPDLVIIYAGHNEYYGALGVGSSVFVGSRPELIRMYLRLKNYRIFQLMENCVSLLVSRNRRKEGGSPKSSFMEEMASKHKIPLGSVLYHKGIEQFQSNLHEILSQFKQEGIPVIISTLVSNEKDIEPFISEELDSSYVGDNSENQITELTRLASTNAKASYLLGKYYLESDLDSARKYLHQAKELDYLRFRAPQELNEVIKNEAKSAGIHLLNMSDIFEEKGIIGNELLTEHVHPNIDGYFTMANAFYEKIKEKGLVGDWSNYVSHEDAYEQIPITKIDSLKGKLLVGILKNSWPYTLDSEKDRNDAFVYFTKDPSYEDDQVLNLYNGVNSWENTMREAFNRYKGLKEYKKALQVAQTLLFEYPEQHRVYDMAAEMSINLSDTTRAEYYLNKSRSLQKLRK
ncbi:SGNH/GDSL hydrolase family protein [Jiulongibacter sp. NS-SX5]|uniref:SGNH/GDSL hydrolase family protein n=1 Tax=Jiulongibacter sp. NS-SX5 TaxID=3463854 RepID=UPI00405A126D